MDIYPSLSYSPSAPPTNLHFLISISPPHNRQSPLNSYPHNTSPHNPSPTHQATGYMDVIGKGSTDAVILVGGSGLVMEAVTGLLRRPDSEDIVDAIPIGIIPTGKRNTLVKALFRSGGEIAVVFP